MERISRGIHPFTHGMCTCALLWQCLLFTCLLGLVKLETLTMLTGHLQPLGSHQPPEGVIDSVDGFLQPPEFFKNYVQASKPILFKGAAKNLPAFQLWNDDYLRNKFGHLPVAAEKGKKETRSKGTRSYSLTQFLDVYKEKDIYMVQDISDLMKEDMYVPESIHCGGFTNFLQLGVLWFSSGGTKSVLHTDESDNINCLLDGEKDIVFIDRREAHKLRENDYNFDGGYSKVDVEEVDMEKFPVFQNLRWWKAHMNKGDCLYIPVEWAHHVNSSGPRNFAVNVWFAHLKYLAEEDCKDVTNYVPQTLSSFRFSQSTEIYHDDQVQPTPLQIFHRLAAEKYISLVHFYALYKGKAELGDIKTVFKTLDANHDKVVTWLEIEDSPLNQLLKSYPFLVPDDVGDETADQEQDAEEMTPDATSSHEASSDEKMSAGEPSKQLEEHEEL